MSQELAENSMGCFHIVEKIDGNWRCVCPAYQFELEGICAPFKVWEHGREYLGRDRKSRKFFIIKRVHFPYYEEGMNYIWDCVAKVCFIDEMGYGHNAGDTDIYEKGYVHADGRWMYDHMGRLNS